jgi:5-oxoprolinase (ATP-hydrolysing)
MQGPKPWEFWIDVGGTFTDCLAKLPDGTIKTHKLLSSGSYKGRIGSGSTRDVIRTLERWGDPPDFFKGYTFSTLTPNVATATVGGFDPAQRELRLATPLPFDPPIGTT